MRLAVPSLHYITDFSYVHSLRALKQNDVTNISTKNINFETWKDHYNVQVKI